MSVAIKQRSSNDQATIKQRSSNDQATIKQRAGKTPSGQQLFSLIVLSFLTSTRRGKARVSGTHNNVVDL